MMKYIGQTPLSALLPGSIRDDATVAASAASLDPIRRALAGGIPNILLEHVPDTPPEYYSCQFKASKLQWYGTVVLWSPAGQPPVGGTSPIRTRMCE